MTRPRPRFLNQVIHGVRRTHGRRCRFTPTEEITNLVGYVIAVFARKHFMRYHAGVMMPNHKHESFTDPMGLRSEYHRDVHSTLAKAMNCLQGLVHESLWDNRQAGETEALDPEAVWDDIIYIVLNPVRAGLVRSVLEWKGFLVGPHHWGQTLTFTRPDFYFSDAWPETAELQPVAPHMADERTAAQLRDEAMRMVRNAARRERRERATRGAGFQGMERVLEVPTTWAPKSDAGAFRLRPRYKSRGEHADDARLLAMQRYEWWMRLYKRAMARRRSRRFPEGTEKYMRLKLVRVDARVDYGMYPLARAAPSI